MAELKKIIKGSLLDNEPMAYHTSYGIGGPAWAYIMPKNKEDLRNILDFSSSYSIPVYFVGSGSNLLVADEGFDGLVIYLGKSFNQLEITGNVIRAKSGVMLGHLVKESIKYRLSGLESLVGVPGTLGGALIMNAGAFGREISNCLTTVEVMDLKGKTKVYHTNDMKFSYRNSSLKKNEIIIEAKFELKNSDLQTILNRKETASRGRKNKQPLRFRSAGSVFKNPGPTLAAGYLIDKAGLKGTRIGDAEISEKHGNFFINHGQATAKDIVSLIRLTKRNILENFNIELELEIKTLGFSQKDFAI